MTGSVMARALAGVFIATVSLCNPVLAAGQVEFLRQKLIADDSAIALGRLAAEKAVSPAVRAFGRILVEDHRISRQKVLHVGQKFDLIPTGQISPEAREERFNLLRMQGREFDREFIEYMADSHQDAIDKFQDDAIQLRGSVSQLAQRSLPVLEKHLLMAQSLRGNDGSFYEGWETKRRLDGPGKGLYAP